MNPEPSLALRLSEWLVVLVTAWLQSLSRHWLAALNILLLLYVSLPFAAPALMNAGAERPARLLYAIYRPACHQLPERSYFLYGEAPVYSLETLEAAGAPLGDSIFSRRHYIGDQEHGYKVAICQRDVAIYGSMFLMGLVFALRRRLPRLSLKGYALLLLPLAADGISQLLGLRESTWQLRTLTGGMFGAATIWLLLPYLAETMQEVRDSVSRPGSSA